MLKAAFPSTQFVTIPLNPIWWKCENAMHQADPNSKGFFHTFYRIGSSRLNLTGLQLAYKEVGQVVPDPFWHITIKKQEMTVALDVSLEAKYQPHLITAHTAWEARLSCPGPRSLRHRRYGWPLARAKNLASVVCLNFHLLFLQTSNGPFPANLVSHILWATYQFRCPTYQGCQWLCCCH